MTLVALDGTPLMVVGAANRGGVLLLANMTGATCDAASEAAMVIGRFFWSDGGTHTVDTSGSSSMGSRFGATTFANAGTTFIMGLATVDLANGPPARATNVADVITFSVSKTMIGNAVSPITSGVWNELVPSAGTMTIATGDLIAFAGQMTTRGGADSITPLFGEPTVGASVGVPSFTTFIPSTYNDVGKHPNCIITASDGTLGWIIGSTVINANPTSLTYGTGSSPNEYGNYFKAPFPMSVYGICAGVTATADFSLVLYSDPLGGSPVPERTVTIDANATAVSTYAVHYAWFPTVYSATANQPLAVTALPAGASTIVASHKTLFAAAHQAADPFGSNGYAVNRTTSGAFAAQNSNKDRFTIGLMVGAFDDGAGSGGGLLRHPGMEGGLSA